MRFIYSFLFYFSLPLVAIRLLWRARRNPQYAKRWSERLGYLPFRIKPNSVWWHCASVGEILAALPLIRLFQQRYPDIPLFITTMTPSGSQMVRDRLGNAVQHSYLPYDLPHIMSRLIKQIQPKALIILETELWPNMLFYARQQQVPVLLANARLSEQSAQGYARFSALTRDMLQNMTAIAAQGPEDAARFVQLGFLRKQITITGNIKFDMAVPADLYANARQLRAQWGAAQRPVWIAASTHAGEEEIILAAAKQNPRALLILAPRHPHRVPDIVKLCQAAQLNSCLRSSGEIALANTAVFIVDTLGELLLFYAMADIAFVGGSLIPRGGHNLLEPAALGLPVLIGESLYNFTEIAKLLEQANALIKIKNADELSNKLNALFQDAAQRRTLGDAAREVVRRNQGAAAKQLLLIEQVFDAHC